MTDLELTTHIHDILKDLGCPISMVGFEYATYAVKLMHKSPRRLAITKELYPAIAAQYNTTAPRVERCIRTLVQTTLDRGSYADIHKVFGNVFRDKSGTIVNGDFLYGLKYELERRIQEEKSPWSK